MQDKDYQRYGIAICILASSFALYDFFIQVIPSVITNELYHTFSLTAKDIGLLGAVFYACYAFAQMPSGWLVDKLGARRTLFAYCLLTGISTIIFANTTYYGTALLARALSGIGISIGFLSTYYLASRWLPHRYFSMVAALLHLAGSVGAMLAQSPLVILSEKIGWRAAINDSGLFGVCLAFIFIFFISDGKKQSIPQPRTPSFFNAFKACLANGQLRWIASIGFLGWLPLSIVGALWGVPYLMVAYHLNKLEASHMCSLFWMGSAIGAVLLSLLSEYLGRRKVPLLLCFIGEVVAGISLVFAPSLPQFIISLSIFILGICVCMQTMSFSLIKENAPIHLFTCAAGMNNCGAMLASASGQDLFGWILHWQHPSTSVYLASDYQVALLIIPLAGLIGLCITHFKIIETYCRIKK